LIAFRDFALVAVMAFPAVVACSEAIPEKTVPARAVEGCSRETPGSTVAEPRDLKSKNGLLKIALKARNSVDPIGHMRYCFVDEPGNQGPTIRVLPGDTLVINLKNEISLASSDSSTGQYSDSEHGKSGFHSHHDPCSGGPMGASSINLHFHGLSIPPVCHQDDTLGTLIEPGDRPFEYRIQIPKNQPPGLYWYHPHVHGFTEEHILGGASGALIVEGMERAVPRVAGLPERVFVIRDEKMPESPASDKVDLPKPTKQLTINYIPVPYPKYPPAVIKIKPQERQFWRMLNASADTFLNLSVEFGGKRQSFNLVALDGVPLHYGEPGAENYSPQPTEIFLPPAGRAEFIITGPPSGVSGILMTHYVFRGAGDDNGPILAKDAPLGARVGQDDIDPARPLASIVTSEEAQAEYFSQPAVAGALDRSAAPLSSVRPARKRTLYFSEKVVDPNHPKSGTQFFITEEGHPPTVFDHHTEPIVVHQGEVEDWTIENRSQESHTFHVHQLHFLVVGSQGVGWEEPTLRDTVNLPAWSGFGRYPSITARMDFRDSNIVGTFPFHCHILQHVDGGMMGLIEVEPAAHPISASK
jgi:FtsP/CotA-like multicopper oxidase with cupredoxin domain